MLFCIFNMVLICQVTEMTNYVILGSYLILNNIYHWEQDEVIAYSVESCDQLYSLVLLRISKSCKRTDSDGFFLKSADPDTDSDSGWKYYTVYTCV